jgi:hypothetical protein
MHLDVVSKCFKSFESEKLNVVGRIEQNLATGQMPDGGGLSTYRVMEDDKFEEILLNPDVS